MIAAQTLELLAAGEPWPVSPEPVWVWAPQPKHPPVEERVRGRVHAAGGGR